MKQAERTRIIPANTRIEDKYELEEGTVFLTGIEAIVRLLVEKQRRDEQQSGAGAVNQTYVSGYEGSPLGGLDLEIVSQLEVLNRRGRTVHQFGINEKTAASAMLGTQYAPSADVDAFWYGKAHGTMWIPDEVWLANLAGTSGSGSMVLLCGEDHRSKSSVSPGSSDWVLRGSMVPIFYPASIEEILSLGMHAIHLSRHLGVVTALKLATPLCDGAGTVRLDEVRPDIHLPGDDFEKRFNPIVMALGALPMQKELVEEKLPLVEEYVRLNRLNRIHPANGTRPAAAGIIATGKSFPDVRQALEILGAEVPVLQLSVTYPLDQEIIREFARTPGLRTIYLVEEPGPFVEEGVKAALWGSSVEGVYGQYDEEGKPFVPSWGEVDPEGIAQLLGPRLLPSAPSSASALYSRLEDILGRTYSEVPKVAPMSCGGCPYNSFRDLKGEKPGGAIGCSSIRAMEAYDYGVLYIPTMGAGGSIYSGTAPFNGNRHSYQYLGDGSYFHSGRGAVQSCVQGDVNITFLLLFNGAVALTGGQRPGGQRSVAEVAGELLALGVRQVGIVSEEPQRYRSLNRENVRVFGLDRHAEALAHFKGVGGTTALILDKECATEKGRRRRRLGERPESYILVHERLCEGCGDCYRQSEGCAALYGTETEFGEKTQIRQASCVQDGLCVDGECPSFVKVTPRSDSVGLRRATPEPLRDLPEPALDFDLRTEDYTIFAVGRGGTGVVTIAHLVAYAGMIDGLNVYLSNNTGLAQKGGPVEAPIVLSRRRQPVFNRLFPGSADLYLGFDLLRAAEPGNLKFASSDRSVALVSSTRIPTARMNRNPGGKFPDPDHLAGLIDQCSRKSDNIYIDTFWLAEKLFGDSLYANMLLLGAAYQAGRLPLRPASIEAAIALNGKAVEANVQAFRWGRLAVADPGRMQAHVGPVAPDEEDLIRESRGRLGSDSERSLHDEALQSIDLPAELAARFSTRIADLISYQDEAYAREYVDFVRSVAAVEAGPRGDRPRPLTRAVILNLHKLMAYKDEYEVARLALDRVSAERLAGMFDGEVRISHYLNPPTLRRFRVGKIAVGPWFRPLFSCLRALRGLRATRWDPFGRTPCRKLERELVTWYRSLLQEVAELLSRPGTTAGDRTRAVEIAEAPDSIRGYEQVKIESAAKARAQAEARLQQLRGGADRR